MKTVAPNGVVEGLGATEKEKLRKTVAPTGAK